MVGFNYHAGEVGFGWLWGFNEKRQRAKRAAAVQDALARCGQVGFNEANCFFGFLLGLVPAFSRPTGWVMEK